MQKKGELYQMNDIMERPLNADISYYSKVLSKEDPTEKVLSIYRNSCICDLTELKYDTVWPLTNVLTEVHGNFKYFNDIFYDQLICDAINFGELRHYSSKSFVNDIIPYEDSNHPYYTIDWCYGDQIPNKLKEYMLKDWFKKEKIEDRCKDDELLTSEKFCLLEQEIFLNRLLTWC